MCVYIYLYVLLPKETEALLTGGEKNPTFIFLLRFLGSFCNSGTDAVRPPVMAKYLTSLLLKGAEAFRQELADQAKQHSITVVNVTAKVASVGENGKNCFHIVTQVFVL